MRIAWIAFVVLLGGFAAAQNPAGPASSDSMSGMDMSHAESKTQDMHDMPGMDQGTATAMHSMESRHMDMGPHMKMTDVRPIQPGDKEKADQVAQAARSVAEKYQDYKLALADGFKIFLPNVPQKQYHFTNYTYAREARSQFDPSKPTSLLYEKNGDGYKLIGVMYTAKEGCQ
jgi:hypothetical protein